MEEFQNRSLDSPFKHSYVGSYHLPPEKLSNHLYMSESAFPLSSGQGCIQNVNAEAYRAAPDAGSRAVIAALKTLQEKMRRLELERVQAERNVRQFSQATQPIPRSIAERDQHQPNGGEKEDSRRKELATQLHTAEARCALLEKQLDYMKEIMETSVKAGKDSQRAKQQERPQGAPELQAQLQKLERLEKECVKLTNTQSAAERKIELLHQKLLQEEHERKLVQEKADELQRELETNLRSLSGPAAAEPKPRKKRTKASGKKSSTARAESKVPLKIPTAKRMPFVTGTSTSPSHSVGANVQSVLHLMKQRHHVLCERASSACASGSESHAGQRHGPASPRHAAPALGGLSELLLALQDELGQMSFEHQELVRQIDETDCGELRGGLERELDCLVKRMEEKASQISKLRRHQQAVQKLSQTSGSPGRRRCPSAEGRSGVRALPPSPVKHSPRGRRLCGLSQDHLQLLRDTQRLRASLHQYDISWER